ncbi:hypothetical protein F4561_001191 [Lipingzhangella halophila]|uniref:Uncharacterized protein n=1 Tax=Lipingzhangella halophila TaxID=1783352 RepID=A0A7W7RFB0_9ACTN|nr:hypothetical protein [Lipingzhangella halophila]
MPDRSTFHSGQMPRAGLFTAPEIRSASRRRPPRRSRFTATAAAAAAAAVTIALSACTLLEDAPDSAVLDEHRAMLVNCGDVPPASLVLVDGTGSSEAEVIAGKRLAAIEYIARQRKACSTSRLTARCRRAGSRPGSGRLSDCGCACASGSPTHPRI